VLLLPGDEGKPVVTVPGVDKMEVVVDVEVSVMVEGSGGTSVGARGYMIIVLSEWHAGALEASR